MQSNSNEAKLIENEITTYFIDVVLPVPISQFFTYRVPDELKNFVKIGQRVIVQFGKKRVMTAIIARIHQNPPKKYQAKYVLEVLDETPLITEAQIKLWQWIAEYYMCHVGEVMNMAVPSGLKISSESKIQLRPDWEIEGKNLSEKELKIIASLQQKTDLSYNEVSEITEVKNVYHLIKSLISKEIILVFEEVKERFQPKTEKKVRLGKEYLTKSVLEKLSKQLEKKPKQLDVLLGFLRHVPVFKDWTLNEKGLAKKVITQNPNLSESSLKTLLKNEIFEEFEVVVSRFDEYQPQEMQEISLSEIQTKVRDEILTSFQDKNVTLLHGVTGSGKTEIYIDLIQKVLDSGSQVLFLLPEIALTTQIVSRLKKVFGNLMGVYHSKFSDNERVEVWQGVVSGRFNFVVGVRSSIFLPFDNLGLIIVDEEHESSYKQHEPAPRYNARDMAMVIALQQHCKVLLGSATPSSESFYQAKAGKFGLVQIKERFGEAELPEITTANLTEERKAKTMKAHFSSKLLQAIEESLGRNEQVILFQNRRGYSPYVMCRDCAWIPQCKSCDVSLTYHLDTHNLKCHYCGYEQSVPKKCPTCGSTRIETIGSGTEKIEDDLKILIPEANVQRMDLDTTRRKNAYQQIINQFESRAIDILVGTQMISKGLDFDNVSLVGVFDADKILNFPDFRSRERAFQIITQVSGRAGRKKGKKGRVVIQTSKPNQEVFHKIMANDYESMYLKEIEDRAYYNYPPFTRLIRLTVKHLQRHTAARAAQWLTEKLRQKLSKQRVLGPEAPIIAKIRNKYLQNILLKIEREGIDLKAAKTFIREQVEDLMASKEFRKTQVVIDVDPV